MRGAGPFCPSQLSNSNPRVGLARQAAIGPWVGQNLCPKLSGIRFAITIAITFAITILGPPRRLRRNVQPAGFSGQQAAANLRPARPAQHTSRRTVATEGNEQIKKYFQDVLYIPDVSEPLSPLLRMISLPLMACYAAVARGHDVDKPRNIAKSVNVEESEFKLLPPCPPSMLS